MSETIYSDKIIVSCPLVHDKDGFYHLIYKTTNLKNGKIYIGKHTTKNPYDNYFGSGTNIIRAVKKYGIENFTKEIMYCFINENDAYLKEAEIVNLKFIDREDTYNIITGGNGLSSDDVRGEKNPFYGKHHKPEAKEKNSKSHKGENNWMFGKRGEKCPNYGKNNPMFGKKHTQDTRNKISKNHADFSGAKNPQAKGILKLDTFGNIITEYGTMKECCEQEHISNGLFYKLIRNRILHNGFYIEYKPKS